MRLKKVEIIKYRNFENIIIDFEKSNFSSVYTIASVNGGGKSTLLQFIFIMLYCFTNDNKKKYLTNILNEFIDISQDIEFVKFIIENNGSEYYLDFSVTKDKSFNLYLDEKELKIELRKETDSNIKKEQQIKQLSSLKYILKEFNRLTPLFKNKFRDAENIFDELGLSTLYEELRIEANQDKVVEEYKKFIGKAIRNIDLNPFDIDIKDLEKEYDNIKTSLDDFTNQLSSKNILYINHIDNNSVLTLQTDMDVELLKSLSTKVFLNAPSSQVYHFLNSDDKKEIFDSALSYSVVLENAKEELNNLYTYDFIPTKLILKSFKKASDEDLKIKRKTNQYGNRYDKLSKDLKSLLDEKEVIENENGDKIIFRLKDSKLEILSEDLSHGELKKLATFIWLKYIVEEGSIILMDEIDIAFHPKWQYQLINDLTEWSKNSQFLLATHSPQILSSTYYKNIIKLEDGKVKRYNKPPIDRDINAIIVEIMEAPNFPQDLLELHKQYRKMVNEGKVDTDDTKKLKEKILEYESESSSFFQDINFHLELM
jgi:predicted ATP-binding protein involved in virulence